MTTCKKRDAETGKLCGRQEATYGVTIEHKKKTDFPTYTVMVCKRCFDDYLADPRHFILSHERGALIFLMQEVGNVEPIG